MKENEIYTRGKIMKQKLSIIVPCYNEESVIELFYKETIKVVSQIQKKYDYEMIFIDDGSKDNTLKLLKELRKQDNNIRIISFSRNFGKEAAIYAGLENSIGDLVVLIDADMQHDPNIIPEMIKEIENGYDTVTTIRKNRKGEPIVKSFFSKMFYRLMKRTGEIELVQGAQDYRMMTRQVVDSILLLKEYNRFSKGIFSWVGFNVKYLEMDNRPRVGGKSKWSITKLFKYAGEGITSFTTAPLKISMILGFIISILSLILGIEIVIQTIIIGKDTPGYASTITAVLFIGGVQLISIGILSEYISKMYLEIKNRPKYIIKEKTEEKD